MKNIWLYSIIFIFFCIGSYLCYNFYVNYISPDSNVFVHNKEFRKKGKTKSLDLYLFYVEWCPHSKNTFKIWNEYKKRYDGEYNISFIEIDCDKHPEKADQYKIDSYPTIILVKDKNKYIFDSNMTNDTMDHFINSIMKLDKDDGIKVINKNI